MQDVALLFHLLGALGFAAGIVLAGAAYETARRREYPAEIALLLGLARIGVLLVGAGGLVIRRGGHRARHPRPGGVQAVNGASAAVGA